VREFLIAAASLLSPVAVARRRRREWRPISDTCCGCSGVDYCRNGKGRKRVFKGPCRACAGAFAFKRSARGCIFAGRQVTPYSGCRAAEDLRHTVAGLRTANAGGIERAASQSSGSNQVDVRNLPFWAHYCAEACRLRWQVRWLRFQVLPSWRLTVVLGNFCELRRRERVCIQVESQQFGEL
jgi:hypothetical protein